MSSKRDNYFRISIIAPKKARMDSDDDSDEDNDDDTAQYPVDEVKRKRKLYDCINGFKLEEKSVDGTIIDTASQIRNEHEVLNDKGKPLIAPASNNPERNNLCTIQNKKINDKLNYANDTNDYLKNVRINSPEPNESHYGNDNFFIDTPKYDQICNENSVDKIYSNSSRPMKSFQNSSDRINSLINSSEEESSNHENNLVSDTTTVIRADSSLSHDSSSTAMTFQKSKKEAYLLDDSDINISESNTIDDNINKFNSDPCHSESTDINTLNENPTNDQEQIQMSFKNQTSELNCISLFTEDERDAIAKLIIDSNLINNEMENCMFPENSKSNDFLENIIRSDDESESDLDEKEVENSENCKLLHNNSKIHNAHGSENHSDNMLGTNEEINFNDAEMTDFSPLSTYGFEYPIPDLPVSRSSSRQESSLTDADIDLDEIHDTDSTSDLFEAELTTDESQSSIETRIVQPQIATSTNKAPVVNVLRLEILTTSLNESSSDEQYKAQRTIHVIENEAHMIRLQKLLYNPNPQYFEGVDRFNLIQGSIPDIIEVLKAYPDSTHHAHVRIFNPDQERYKNTVCNTYFKNSSKGSKGDCAICMYTLFNPVSTWCGHIFCENCLLHSIEYNRECPSCRKHLSIPYYHKVFI